MRSFAEEWPDPEFVQQAVAQLRYLPGAIPPLPPSISAASQLRFGYSLCCPLLLGVIHGPLASLKISTMSTDRKDRKERLTEFKSGAWASSSQDLMLANDLFAQSLAYAKRFDHNVSPYPIAGIPLLVSTLRALLIEANSGMYGLDRDSAAMGSLANNQNEIILISEKYVGVGSETAKELCLLYEVRNEIVHPAHTPSGTKHNTPLNMLPLRDRGLLQSSGKPDSDYTWISQLQSHRLFLWSFITVERVADAVLARHYAAKDSGAIHLKCYGQYRDHYL